jgi:hypothetical protein
LSEASTSLRGFPPGFGPFLTFAIFVCLVQHREKVLDVLMIAFKSSRLRSHPMLLSCWGNTAGQDGRGRDPILSKELPIQMTHVDIVNYTSKVQQDGPWC